MDIFDQILDDLSKHLGTPLKADENHTCLISIKDKIFIQVEPDRTQEYLIVGTALGELQPGKYRENILREALKCNNDLPRPGIFAFSDRKHELVLFEKRRASEINGDQVHEIINQIVEKALPWKEAIARGDVPSSIHGSAGVGSSSSSIFAIKK